MDTELYIATMFFVAGSLIGIFSPDIRTWLVDKYYHLRFMKSESYNNKIEKRIDLIRELSQSPVSAIGYISGHIFMGLLLISLVLFHGIMLIINPGQIITGLGFIVFWFFSVIFVAFQVDLCFQLRCAEKSILVLQSKKRKTHNK